MQQILFFIPFTQGVIPPDGIPVPGFGMMLFLAFVVIVTWGGWRSPKIGLPANKLQDLAIALFLAGIAGARLLYMIQYAKNFPDKTPWGLFTAFFSIWEGGIVFYGSLFGGIIAYWVFRRRVLKPLGVNGWQLADCVAPLMATGMAIGRIGCLLNGCCWGQVACEECQVVPLGTTLGRFPLLPAHARNMVIPAPPEDAAMPHLYGLQTSVGFVVQSPTGGDPRSLVAKVEPGSEAEAAGLKAGDRIAGVNGAPNRIRMTIYGDPSTVSEATKIATDAGATATAPGEVEFADAGAALAAMAKLSRFRTAAGDSFSDSITRWPRGRNRLDLDVERDGKTQSFAFTPRTVSFFPTQAYETVSMLLLTLLLLAFHPFRRHDGQVMVLLMLGYAAHRFLNEALRIEPAYYGLTLSQWISVGIFAAGLALEAYLRWSQPRR